MAAPPERFLATGPWDDLSMSVLRGSALSALDVRDALDKKSLKSTHLRAFRQMLTVSFDHLDERGFLKALDRELVPRASALAGLQPAANSMAAFRGNAKTLGLNIDSRSEEAFRTALGATGKADSYRAKTISQRGVAGPISDLLSTLDRAVGLIERHEKAAMLGSAPTIRVQILQGIGEALTYIGGGIAAAAGAVLVFAEAATTVAVVATGFFVVGAALVLAGAVAWLLGQYMLDMYME